METFEYSSVIPASAAAVFAWHERPQALAELIPPGAPVKVLEHTGGIHDGALVVLAIGWGPLRLRWFARHQDYRPGVSFVDVQERGPFTRWQHTHSFEALSPDTCRLRDHIAYALPLGLPGALVKPQLERMFRYRHAITAQAFGIGIPK